MVDTDAILDYAPGGLPDVLGSYRLGCCGLAAAKHVLAVNGLPAPDVAQIRADGPLGRCCAELTVTPKAPLIVYDDPDNLDCVARCVHVFEVCMARCVSDWFGNEQNCDTSLGDCSKILTCPPDEPWVAPTACGQRGRTQADEHALVLADRAALSLQLADAWACCISSPDVSGCGDCASPILQSCRRVVVTEVEDYCESGCVGTILKLEIH